MLPVKNRIMFLRHYSGFLMHSKKEVFLDTNHKTPELLLCEIKHIAYLNLVLLLLSSFVYNNSEE